MPHIHIPSTRGFVFLIALLVAAQFGCAEGQVGPGDGGDNVRTEDDAGPGDDADAGTSDDGGESSTDMAEPPPRPGPSRAAVSSGGGVRASENYRLDVVVGAPTAASRLTSENFRVGVGVGPFVAEPTTPDGEASP